VEQVHDGYIADASLDSRDVRPVKVGSLGKLLLRHSELQPLAPYSIAELFPGIGDSRTPAPIFPAPSLRVHSI
jgi:hypothetical protein